MPLKLVNHFNTRIESFSPKRWSVILFVTSLVLALLFSFIISPFLMETTSGLDPDGYGRVGRTLYETGQFQSISKAPLYPAFIALISWLSDGYQLWVVQLAQCIIFALTCVVLYVIFQRTLFPRTAKYAGLLCSIYPMSIWYVPRLWTETFLTLIIALFTLSLIKTLQKQTTLDTLICGVMVGIAALSKGIAIVFLPLVTIVLAIRLRSKNILLIFLFILGALTLVAPWTWRNWQLTGRFLPIHANGGYNFYLGNGFTKHWLESPLSYIELKARTTEDMEAVYSSIGFEPADPVSVDDVLVYAALTEMQDRPYLVLQKLVVQSFTFWYLAASSSKSLLTGIMQIPIVLLSVPGTIRALRYRSWALCFLVPIVGIMGMAVLVFSFGRLSATIMPYLIGIMVYGLLPMADPATVDTANTT